MFSIFGNIRNPLATLAPAAVAQYKSDIYQGGLLILLNNLLKLSITIAGIYAFLNIVLAGYGFLSSQEPKEVAKAWAKIWQSMLGLLIVAGSFVLAAIFGWIIFKDATALLNPKVYGP